MGGQPQSATRDKLVGVAAAAVLLAAMAGVFLYERSQFQSYDVTWSTTPAGSTADTATLDQGASTTVELAAEANRLAAARLVVTWSDDVGDPDTLQVELTGPDGSPSDTVTGSTSPLELTLPITPKPTTSQALGRDPDAARDQLEDASASALGAGTWVATVTLESAPGETVAGQETQPDGSQAVEMNLTVDAWVPTLDTRS